MEKKKGAVEFLQGELDLQRKLDLRRKKEASNSASSLRPFCSLFFSLPLSTRVRAKNIPRGTLSCIMLTL